MNNFVLSTDSCCDAEKSQLRRDGIYYIPMAFICEGEIFEDTFESQEEYNLFYEQLKSGKKFSTTGLNPYALKEYFERILNTENCDIVHIALSSGLSGTCNLTKQVADEINKTSKNKIYVVDSLGATQSQNYLVYCGKVFQNEKKDAKTTSELVQNLAKNLSISFFLTELETLRRGGRISGAAAMIGSFLQLRPILKFDQEGKLQVSGKVVGTKKAIQTLFENMKNNWCEDKKSPVFLAYAGDNTSATELKTLIETKLGATNVHIGPVGPVIASHTGPCLTGLIFTKK